MIKINPLPPLEFLNECFELDSILEGGLRWKGGKKAGKPAGTKNKNYWSVSFLYNNERRSYKSQRIIYSLFYNEIVPDNILVDHIDRNPSNNNPSNLRLADFYQNLANKNVYKNNPHGIAGISFDKKESRWLAYMQIKKQRYLIGRFDTIEEATFAREEANKIRLSNYSLEFSKEDFAHLAGRWKTICKKCLVNKANFLYDYICYDCSSPEIKSKRDNMDKKGECIKCGGITWEKNTLCGECFRIKWPSVEEMTSLIWEKTAKDIGLLYNVGEDSVTRFCRRNKIPQPSRKYREDQKKLLSLD